MIEYLPIFLTMGGIYGILTLALNLQFGFTGLLNFGIAAFFAVGAYSSAILTVSPTPEYIGGFSLPFIVGIIGAGLFAGFFGYIVGLLTLRFREAYFAIATLGVMEIIRTILKQEKWIANGLWGVMGVPKLFPEMSQYLSNSLYALVILAFLGFCYLIVSRIIRSPWGRVLAAIREDERLASSLGKDAWNFKMQSVILGSTLMGIAGALYAHYMGYVNPHAFEPVMACFVIWAMLVIGGAGNNLGAIIGSFIVWLVWTQSEFLTTFLPSGFETRAAYIRTLILGISLIVLLRFRPKGLIGRIKSISKYSAE